MGGAPYSGGAPPRAVYPGAFAPPAEARWVSLAGPAEVPPFWAGARPPGGGAPGGYGIQSGVHRVANETLYNGRPPPSGQAISALCPTACSGSIPLWCTRQ